jgi:PKD repeat protein
LGLLIDVSLGNYSDNKSFWDEGYAAILAIDDNDNFTPYYRTTNDELTTLNMPYFAEFVKASLGTLAHLSGCECEGVHEAGFSWNPQNPTAGEVAYFLGTATGEAPIAFDWDFGDEGQGSGVAVSHVYAAEGAYTVTLTATNACASSSVSHTLTVLPTSCEAVRIVSTTAKISACAATLSTDLMGTAPFAYGWDLGAFGVSAAPAVSVDFGSSGTYPYTLTIANCGGGSTDSATGTVTVACEVPKWYLYLPLVVRGE